MRWKYLFLFYIKQMFKNKLYIVPNVVFFILLISRLKLFFSRGMEAYGQFPGEIAMIVQMLSIFYIIYFYRIYSKELLYGVQHFFIDGYRIMLEKISTLFFAHFLYQGVIFLITYGIFVITYFIIEIENSSFYLSVFRFLLVYMFSPFIFSMLFGVIIAILFGTKKSSFIAIFIIWIATGSMNSELFINFFSTILADDWRSLFFIGMNSPNLVYYSYTGFDVHWGNELKLLTWLILLIGIILALSSRWILNTKRRKFTSLILIIMSFLALTTAYGVTETSTRKFSRADSIQETNYYKNVRKAETDLRYNIESYSISLDKKQVTTKLTFSTMNTLEPTFQLYHAYPINWIKVNGKPVHFERNGDIVKIYLPKTTSSITFYYEIVDTNFIPYTNGRMVLLADKAWYPKKSASHIYEINPYTEIPEPSKYFNPNEVYSFTLRAKQILFCNLPKKGDSYYGKAQAITLIKGQGNTLTYDNYHIIYPADWIKTEERIPTVLTQLKTTLYEIQLLAPITVQSLPSNLIFSDYGLSSFMTTDHLVYNTGYGDALNSYDVTKEFQEKLLQFVVQQKGSNDLYKEWVNMTSKLIRQKMNLEIDNHDRTINSYSLSTATQKQIELIYSYFRQLNTEQQQQFLHTWYKEMDESWTWKEVLNLVKESKSSG